MSRERIIGMVYGAVIGVSTMGAIEQQPRMIIFAVIALGSSFYFGTRGRT